MLWQPVLCTISTADLPEPGWLIGAKYRAWNVISVEAVPREDWTEQEHTAWVAASRPDPWLRQPHLVTLTPYDLVHGETDDDEYVMRVEPWYMRVWYVLPEHFAVCRHCQELAPCRAHMLAEETHRAAEAAFAAMQIPDGCCPACGDLISGRQRTIEFPGPNLLNPLGAPDVRFHDRRACRRAAAQYEEKWVTADPSRPRSPLTQRCGGTLIVHEDGTAYCVHDEGTTCPGVYAHHAAFVTCRYVTGECEKGCAGSFPARLARGLNPDGTRAY